jgi:hypothetical protein
VPTGRRLDLLVLGQGGTYVSAEVASTRADVASTTHGPIDDAPSLVWQWQWQ